MNGPIMKAAKSRAALMGFPGSYIFAPDQPPVYKNDPNSHDCVIDVEATEAQYATPQTDEN